MEFWTTTELVINGIMLTVTFTGIYLWIRSLWVSKVQFGTYLLDRSTPARWGLVDVVIVVVLYLVMQSVFAVSFLQIYGITPEEAGRFGLMHRLVLTAKFGELLGVLGGIAYLFFKYRHKPSEFGLSLGQFNVGFRTGVICFLMWIPVVWAVHAVLSMFIPYEHETLNGIKSSPGLLTVIDLWITAVVFAPIIEELLFRGIIQPWIQRCRSSALERPDLLLTGERMSSKAGSDSETLDSAAEQKRSRRKHKQPLHLVSIVITSIMFGSLHAGQGAAPVSLFVFSLGLGYLYQRTGNLLACIVTHMALNAFTMAMVTFQ